MSPGAAARVATVGAPVAAGMPAPWLPRWWVAHAWGMVAVTVAAAAVGGPLTRAPVGVQVAALATAVALFGVPHGALDPLVGRTLLAPRLGRRWWPIFHAGYLAVAGIVLAGWAAAPVGTLAGFLAISAVHFGLGDVTRGRQSPGRYAAEVLARGALPIVGPAAAFPDQVATLFGWLVPVSAREGAAALADGLAWAGPRLLAPLLAGVMLARLADALRARGRDDHLAVAAEVGALALLVLAAPPLVAFLVYFCGWHSARHTLELAAHLEPRRPGAALGRFARLAASATAVTLTAAVAAWLAWRPAAGAVPAAVRTLFVGLSALTVPHMALTAWAAAASRARGDRRGGVTGGA